jgi:CHASE2 domain-containing sensor protein
MNAEQLAQVLTLLVATIFPVLVGLVTTRATNPSARALLLATLSLAAGLISSWLAALNGHVDFDLFTALVTGVGAWVVAVATHFGLWKPTGVSAAVIAVGSKPEPRSDIV